MKRRALAGAALLLFATACAASEPFSEGRSRRTVNMSGEDIEVFAYKPASYAGGQILLVLHGLGTNASGYRDHAIPLADRLGFLVIAPLFDRKRFPTWRYQTGGLVRDQRSSSEFAIEPEAQWMGQLLLDIIKTTRSAEGQPDLPYSLIGHSAGGQALSRFAAFMPQGARHIVIANPSTYLWPSLDLRFPYGYGGLPAKIANDDALRRYLAQPVTLLLGTADTKRDNDLNVRASAELQGRNRFERGNNAFSAAQQLAKDRGWSFNWRLIDVPDTGHSARQMFSSMEAQDALSAR